MYDSFVATTESVDIDGGTVSVDSCKKLAMDYMQRVCNRPDEFFSDEEDVDPLSGEDKFLKKKFLKTF